MHILNFRLLLFSISETFTHLSWELFCLTSNAESEPPKGMICAKEDFFPFHIKQVEADNPDIKIVWHVCSKWKYCLNVFGNEVSIMAPRKDWWWESLNVTLILVILTFGNQQVRVSTYQSVFQSCSWEPPALHVIHVHIQHSWFKCRAWWCADHLYQVSWVRE